MAVGLFIGIFTYDVIIPSLKVDLSPNDADYYYNLGNKYSDLDKYQEAIVAYKRAIKINQDYAEAYTQLGNAYFKLSMYREAVESYEIASVTGDELGTNNLAWILSTCPDDDIRDGKRAIHIMELFFDKEDNDPIKIDTLAAAYAEAGNFSEAIKLMHEAIEKIDKNEEPEVYKELQLHLKSFENKQPWREKIVILHPR